MSEHKNQIPKKFASLDVIDRFTIAFDKNSGNNSNYLSEKLRSAMSTTNQERFKRTLLLVAKEIKKMELSGETQKETLAKLASSESMTCEYYPCGSCTDDGAAVCCYYDSENPPVCVCESC